ncbi:MAG TPA: NAD(P)H-dependent oxidoreductase [Virgibacillus sp.]|nr:NAD(P)H-dependent oxidoreductase [Virgibacillus sp.]
MKKVAVLVGSLRKQSFSKQVAKNVADLFPENYDMEFVNIGDLPLYNQDYDMEGALPDTYVTFREEVRAADAILFVTPEYNRSVPGVLKNAIDVGSRPKETSVWNNKPAGIISVAPGNLSAFGANHHLRQSLVFFNMPVVQQPEAYIGNVAGLLGEDGKITAEDTVAFLQTFVDAFVNLVQKHSEN